MTTQRWLESGRTFCFLAIWFAFAGPAAAATLPSGFTESLVAAGLASPTAMQFAPDGRLFVCEQGGRLRVIKNGALLPTPFLTRDRQRVGRARSARAWPSIPNFATNRFVYVYYTATTPTVHNRISRFTANGDVAVAGSEVVLLDLDNLSSATNHNGGALHFGPDGKLYAAVGDNANGANAQSLANLLRQDAPPQRRRHDPGRQPVLHHGHRPEPGDLGARPAQSVHVRVQPGRAPMFINDVGENTWEEINDGHRRRQLRLADDGGRDHRPAGSQSPRYAYNHGSRRARSPAARFTRR